MEVLFSLLRLLNEEQKKGLRNLYSKSKKAEERLLVFLLDGEVDEKKIIKKLIISPATFNKVQTQAKDLLAAYVQSFIENPLDEVSLVQHLLLKGEIKAATKFYNALEKDYESQQKWQMLDALYKEGFRLGQLTGNLKFIEEVTVKRNHYIDKYAVQAKLFADVMIEMVRTEKYESRGEDAKTYLNKILQLNKRAQEVGHHALIHNSLSILYNHYSRFYDEPDKTWDVVKKVEENRKQYSFAMDAPTQAISRIILVNFLCTCEGYGSPEEHLSETLKHIDTGGAIARANVLYAVLGYYLAEEKTDRVTHYLHELEKIQDNTYFASFKSIVLAIQSFIKNDNAGFHVHYNVFLQQPNHIALPDYEVMVRILELIILHRDKEDWLYKSKAEALRVYFNRNLNKERYAEEYSILTYLITPSKKNREKLEKLPKSKYRNSRFLAKHVLTI